MRETPGVRVEKWWHLPFVVYAGPWAEARSQWTRDSLDSLDDEDDDGRPFRDYVREAFDVNRDGDLDNYEQLEKGYFRTARGPSRRPPEWLNSRGAQEMR